MNIIKLNAIPSTNDYLKELSQNTKLDDFTVVVAEHQTKGKGQMGSVWKVEPATNLTFSVLLNSNFFDLQEVFTLNIAVANVIHKVLLSFELSGVKVKWPNDIMSYNKKIGGILIENNIKADGKIHSIIGIGLNVSQTDFGDLAQASSILKSYEKLIDKKELMVKIVTELKKSILDLKKNKNLEWDYYHENLFKKNIPMTFELKNGSKFTGMIINVNSNGQLGIRNEADELLFFSLKEIKMLY
nr:biotin--[acetyl-CoA-carboxylase] ligase [uncultured Flavobacterium sp.]